MNFNRRAQDRLRTAERFETVDSEALFVADLRNLLDDTAIREGVSINFGDSQEAFQLALDLLDVETLTGDSRYFNMMQGIVRDGNSSSMMSKETVAPIVDAQGVRGAIELMQADAWRLTDGTFKKITTSNESVTSWLMLNHVAYSPDGTFDLVPDSTTVMAGVSVLYQPEALNEYGENGGVAYQFEDALKTKIYRQRIARFGELLDMNESELRLPQTSYILQIGQNTESDSVSSMFGYAPTGMYPRYGFYDLKNGRIIRNVEASHDNLE